MGDHYTLFGTPLGWCGVAWSQLGLLAAQHHGNDPVHTGPVGRLPLADVVDQLGVVGRHRAGLRERFECGDDPPVSLLDLLVQLGLLIGAGRDQDHQAVDRIVLGHQVHLGGVGLALHALAHLHRIGGAAREARQHDRHEQRDRHDDGAECQRDARTDLKVE